MKRAGHLDFKTTRDYVDLAGVHFREKAYRAEDRVFADVEIALAEDQ